MIIKDITYKWFTFDSTNNIVMNENNKTVSLRTDIFNKQNFHGARSSNTLAEWRLFTFSWLIYGETYQERQNAVDYINNLIKPEWIPTETNRGFYQLTFKDWNWNIFKTQAKVFRMCEFRHAVNEPIIEFSFELYSEQAWYYGFTDKVFIWEDTWNVVWVEFSTEFSFSFSTISNTLQINNEWDFIAPCSIRIFWDLENPIIYNNTTWTAYKLDWVTTSDLVIDNRWSRLIVTDEWLDVSKYRWSWSSSVFLAPWINEIFIFGDNVDPAVTVTIEYNDTFIGS